MFFNSNTATGHGYIGEIDNKDHCRLDIRRLWITDEYRRLKDQSKAASKSSLYFLLDLADKR